MREGGRRAGPYRVKVGRQQGKGKYCPGKAALPAVSEVCTARAAVLPRGRGYRLKKARPETTPGNRDQAQLTELQAWDRAPLRDRALPGRVRGRGQVREDTDPSAEAFQKKERHVSGRGSFDTMAITHPLFQFTPPPPAFHNSCRRTPLQ